MNTSSVVRIVCWSIVAILLVGFLTSGLLNKNDNFSFGFNDFKHCEKYSVGEAKFDKNSVKSMDINWVSGSINYTTNSENEVSIYEEDEKLNDSEKMRYYLDDNGKLTIQFCENKWFNNFKSSFKTSKKLHISVPQDFKLDVFKISMVSANAEINNLNCNEIDAEDVSGRSVYNNTRSFKADFETIRGKIDLKGGFARLDCESVSGNISVNSEICPQNFDAETISGSVELYIPENEGFIAKLDSLSGYMDSEFQTTKNSKNKITYKNGQNVFDVETVSGKFTIKYR